MQTIAKTVNAADRSVFDTIPKNHWEDPEAPLTIMDQQTYELIQADDLYNAINYTKTITGKWTLRQSVNQPLTDSELITEKQSSLAEMRGDTKLRNKLAKLVIDVAKDEGLLYDYKHEDYVTNMNPLHPNLYNAYKGSTRILGHLANDLANVKPETEYLTALLDNLKMLKNDRVEKLVEGPVYKTFSGLKPKEELGVIEPRFQLKPTDWKFTHLLIDLGPVALPIIGAVVSKQPAMLVLMAYSAMWPIAGAVIGRSLDDKNFIAPLRKIYFENQNVIRAIDTLGKLDELLSLAQYADSLKSPITLPHIVNTPAHMFKAEDLKNPILVKENPHYIGNDIALDGSKLTFLTGPNSGGKTALSKSILQSQILAQMGSYIPAEQATISVADGIFYHAPTNNTLHSSEGGFGTEVARIRDILFKATPKSIVILDEIMKGTTFEEQKRHSRNVLNGLYTKACNTLLVTHNHELTQEFKDRNMGQFWQVEFAGEKATHKTIPGIAADSHSDAVVKREGLTEQDIENHLKKEGYL